MITAAEARERSSKNQYDELRAIMSLIETETMKTDKQYIILHELPSKQTRLKLNDLGYYIIGECPIPHRYRYTDRCIRYYISWHETKEEMYKIIDEEYEW